MRYKPLENIESLCNEINDIMRKADVPKQLKESVMCRTMLIKYNELDKVETLMGGMRHE